MSPTNFGEDRFRIFLKGGGIRVVEFFALSSLKHASVRSSCASMMGLGRNIETRILHDQAIITKLDRNITQVKYYITVYN